MKLAREMERRLERLVDGASAAVFRGKMHPVDMADRLLRQADFVVAQGESGPEIPNIWTLRINPSDLPPEIDHEELERELTHAVADFAVDHGWRINGPVGVEVISDTAVPRGLTDCSGVTEPGPIPPWSQLVAASPPLVVEISDNRSILGRATESDVVVSVPELSRRQAIIVRAEQAVTIADLSSANGTHVNGALIGADPFPLVPGDTVTMGDIDFVFRSL
ncbi:MAG: FhaA domain-containing protein [Actinomycetota bacterium]|nr:FhaA domain-containing protein [Actinomycetota bacterium]